MVSIVGGLVWRWMEIREHLLEHLYGNSWERKIRAKYWEPWGQRPDHNNLFDKKGGYFILLNFFLKFFKTYEWFPLLLYQWPKYSLYSGKGEEFISGHNHGLLD